jgi:hypothetical protein
MSLTKPVPVKFGKDEDAALDTYVYDNLISLKESFRNLHENLVPKWRRLIKGKPKDETRNFPWPNASNVVVQLIGENVDVLKATQLGSIFEILPLFVAGLVGDWPEENDGDGQRTALEEFLNLMGLSKKELDLYRLESRAAHDNAGLGSVLIKLPWVTQTEAIVTGIDSDSKPMFEDKVIYDGPRPEKLKYEDWAATPTANTFEEAGFKYHKYKRTKMQCEQKVFDGSFAKDAWEKIKNSPDLDDQGKEQEESRQTTNIDPPQPGKNTDIWIFYECWLKYWLNDKLYNIFYTMHLGGGDNGRGLRMSAFFNFYPKNEEPFEFCRLGYSEDGLIGYGFAEMGEMYQEEVSTGHNQRVDNRTLANTSVLLGGRNARIDAGISLFPMAVLPFDKNDVDVVQLGANYPSSVSEEQLTLALAKARFGTDMPGSEGMGSGSVDKKGNYNSMGTFSIMQAGNRRININVTDFRYMHLNLGQKSINQYATFGVGEDRLRYLGRQAELLQKALENIKSGRIELPIKAATASINKEIEKQTGMLFTQVMQRHYGAIAQILQGVTNPVIPPEIKQFLLGSIGGMSYIMSKLLRAFGYDDISRMQPEVEILKAIRQQMKQMQEQQGANNGQRGVQASAGQTGPTSAGQGLPEGSGQPTNNSTSSETTRASTSGQLLQ